MSHRRAWVSANEYYLLSVLCFQAMHLLLDSPRAAATKPPPELLEVAKSVARAHPAVRPTPLPRATPAAHAPHPSSTHHLPLPLLGVSSPPWALLTPSACVSSPRACACACACACAPFRSQTWPSLCYPISLRKR